VVGRVRYVPSNSETILNSKEYVFYHWLPWELTASSTKAPPETLLRTGTLQVCRNIRYFPLSIQSLFSKCFSPTERKLSFPMSWFDKMVL
jgi:hypothetical protein